ncbi:E1A-binding protein p400-like isoform X1 [Rhincodon typus]|uniref:E1A-binding protein p400-like isoform X1 n=1 Tax=Rhincodon typus TaxID=259920 RepID=UPI00202E4C14|nr:E1A-binding protein p400-like isoform X1 [Rhincodon typus]
MAPVTATAAAVVTTNLTPVQSQTRSLVTQVTPATGIQLTTGKPISQAQIQLFRQPQTAPVQVQQIQPQSQTSAQLKTVQKLPDQLIKLKQKQQQQQQLAQVTQRNTVLTGAVTNLPVARIARVSTSQLQAQGQIQAQSAQTAQVTLTKPPVVSVPTAVVSSGVTTLPVTVAGISVAISQPQKGSTGGQTVVKTAIPQHFSQMQVQQLLKLKQQQQQQKAGQAQVTQGQAALQAAAITAQQKITQQVTVQSQQQQQQKVTYTTAQLQSGMKPQFLSAQTQKPTGTQQMQAQIQDSSSSADTSSVFVARLFNKQSGFNRLVTKLPQMVQQQATVGSIQQMVSTAQQVQAQPQTMTLSQAATGQQVQVIPAAATAQVVQQQLIQQQVVTTASPQIQPPTPQSPAQPAATSDAQGQQAKVQARTTAPMRLKAPTKPN